MDKWDFDGVKYTAASRHQKEWGEGLIAQLHLTGTEIILDLGCGDGILSAKLAALVPEGQVLGIDSSPSMIASAQKHQMSNLSLQPGDINTIDYEGQFDLIYSNAALHWVLDHDELFRRCYIALKPGGRLRFSFGGAGNCQNFLTVVTALMGEPPFAQLLNAFHWPWFMPGLEEYKALLGRSPFTCVQAWMENADRCFDNAQEITNWIDQPSLVPFMAALDQQSRELFRNQVVERMLSRTVQPDGRYFETFRRLNVLARK